MKIIKTKGYKKPLYAIGVAAALTAIAVTGCGDDKPVYYAGDLQPMTETTDEVELEGEATVDYAGDVAEYTDETEPVNTRQSTERVTLDGGVEFADPGQEN